MTEWWTVWGQAVMWAVGAVSLCSISILKFQRQLDRQFNRVDMRLLQIEIVLGIKQSRRSDRLLPVDEE